MDDHDTPTPTGTNREGGQREASCCPGAACEPAPLRSGRRATGTWVAVGAVFTAVLSSACCWLPLLLIGFGVSAAGVAGAFERYRPLLLTLTGILLAAGFYLTYVRRPTCAPGAACAPGHGRLRRVQKAPLWIAALLVGAFALFPNYVTALLDSLSRTAAPAAASDAAAREVVLRVHGMTCEGCASGLAARLRAVPGVVRAEVDFEGGRARAWLRSDTAPAALLEAVEQLGYEGEVEAGSP